MERHTRTGQLDMQVYKLALKSHSTLRYLALAGLASVLVAAARGMAGRKPYSKAVSRLSLGTFLVVHAQYAGGLALYFLSPRVHLLDGKATENAHNTYWTVTHIAGHTLGVLFLSINHFAAELAGSDEKSYRRLFWWTLAGVATVTATLYASKYAPGLLGHAAEPIGLPEAKVEEEE